MKKTIAISLSPNVQKDDVLLALKNLFTPINWYDFTKTEKLEVSFSEYFGKEYRALAVNSGRSALYLILKSLGIGYGDEVIIQALTCIAVPNAVIWTGATPVYVDVGNDLNINPESLKSKITSHTKAIVIQNSFGIPADYTSINKVVNSYKRKIYVIEDCALSLGAKFKGKKIGTLGDVSFFSFGRDKVISSVSGGMILCKKGKLYLELKKARDNLDYPRPYWLIQQLMHPIIFSIALFLYNFGNKKFTLGKIIIFISQKLGLISKSIYKEEEDSKRPKIYPKKIPGALSEMALNQFNKLEKFNKHRNNIAQLYFKKLKNSDFILPPNKEDSVWVRFPVIRDDAMEIIDRLKRKGILLGDWYRECVVPTKDLSKVYFVRGICKKAEKIKGKILNLPTYPGFSISDAKYILSLIK